MPLYRPQRVNNVNYPCLGNASANCLRIAQELNTKLPWWHCVFEAGCQDGVGIDADGTPVEGIDCTAYDDTPAGDDCTGIFEFRCAGVDLQAGIDKESCERAVRALFGAGEQHEWRDADFAPFFTNTTTLGGAGILCSGSHPTGYVTPTAKDACDMSNIVSATDTEFVMDGGTCIVKKMTPAPAPTPAPPPPPTPAPTSAPAPAPAPATTALELIFPGSSGAASTLNFNSEADCKPVAQELNKKTPDGTTDISCSDVGQLLFGKWGANSTSEAECKRAAQELNEKTENMYVLKKWKAQDNTKNVSCYGDVYKGLTNYLLKGDWEVACALNALVGNKKIKDPDGQPCPGGVDAGAGTPDISSLAANGHDAEDHPHEEADHPHAHTHWWAIVLIIILFLVLAVYIVWQVRLDTADKGTEEDVEKSVFVVG